VAGYHTRTVPNLNNRKTGAFHDRSFNLQFSQMNPDKAKSKAANNANLTNQKFHSCSFAKIRG